MLEVMRKALKGWAGKLLIALFTLPFLFLGAESFFSVFNSQKGVININGEAITAQQVANAVESNKERLRQRFGPDFDMSVFSDEALREGAENQLIELELSKQYAEANNLSVSLAELSKTIRQIPNFAGENGLFSQEVFETIAAQQGMTTKQIIEIVKEDMSVSQPRQAISSSSFALKNEVLLKERLNAQKRDIAYLLLSLDEIRDGIEVSEEEIQAYYEQNLADFMTEEMVRLEYVELNRKDFESDIDIPEEDVKAQFDAELAALFENADRKAAHILIPVGDEYNEEQAYEKISGLKQELQEGADFAELAKQHSGDPGSANAGGDLGFAGRGVYAPEFEESLFGLELGEVSEPVLTEFGYHLIQLNAIEEVEQSDFESEKTRIATELKKQAAQDRYQNKISEVEEVIFESPDLDEAASRAGLEIKVSDFFTRNEGEGIANNEDVRQLAFSNEILLDGLNSSVTEIEQGKAIALRLNEYRPSEEKGLDTVKEQIELSLKTEKAEQVLQEKQSELLTMLQSGESMETIAEAADAEWESVQKMSRRQQGVPQEVVKQAFEMPHPQADNQSVASVSVKNDIALLALTKVYDEQVDINDRRMMALIMRDSRNAATSVWTRYVDYLREQADIAFFASAE